MTTQIAVRLPDDVVKWLDRQVAEGRTRSRASAVERALRHEIRRQIYARDAEIYASLKDKEDPDDLEGLAAWAAKHSSWDELD
jgi:predicted transcriptional regulator